MDWIIGDIHGCLHTLRKLLEKVRIADRTPQFVFVGDYVDRGKWNKEVIELMIQLQSEGAVCLCGNHDNVVNWILTGNYRGHIEEMIVGRPTFENVIPWWLQNGLRQTTNSYGAFQTETGPYGAVTSYTTFGTDFRNAVPDHHKKFFDELGLYWESDTHFACHGFMRPFEELPRTLRFMSAERADETLWGRFDSAIWLEGKKLAWDKVGVFGHTPVHFYGAVAPISYDKLRLVDTGACSDGYLCAYCCQTDDWIVQTTELEDLM